MTTKQIAVYLGKPEKTVRTWASIASAKSAAASAKSAASSPTHPADWDLNETCLIIEEGMGKDVADVYRNNAANTDRNSDMVTRSDLADFGRALVGEMMKQFLPLITAQQPKQIEFIQDYFTIKGYANKIGINITYSEAITIGRAAARRSRELGREVKQADDERYGHVGSYHVSILDEVFRP